MADQEKKCYFFAIKSGYNLSIGDENEEENDGKDQLKHTHTHTCKYEVFIRTHQTTLFSKLYSIDKAS